MYHAMADYEQIDNAIQETKDLYIYPWYCDRLDSEIQKKFVIRCSNGYPWAIVFETVEQFVKWIRE